MKLEEFKAWFEGFTENLDGPPNAKQWARIKKRVGEIDGFAVTYPVYIERYWPRCPSPTIIPQWTYTPAYVSGGTVQGSKTASVQTFNAIDAMHAAGRNEALTIQ